MNKPEEAKALAEEYIENASEKEVIKTYVDEDTTGDLYLEGSKFKDPAVPNRASKKPHFLRR